MIGRRGLLAAGLGALAAGCSRIAATAPGAGLLGAVEDWNRLVQRWLGGRTAMAREFSPDLITAPFRSNGTRDPATPEYAAHAAAGFANWRLVLDGLVARPQSFSLADLAAMPQRAQITRHDCVEGWSAIGKWQGVPLALLLEQAGLADSARFLVFHCADSLSGGPYYESIDRFDAFHPQTIIAHQLNDAPLPIANGAPLRLRVERQLGYKHAKYLTRIEAVASLAGIRGGRGGYWEDRGYAWYAGI